MKGRRMTLEGFNIDGLSAGQYAAAVIPFLGYESAEQGWNGYEKSKRIVRNLF